ncbi:MATE family efflux transporter [Alcaligenaceae bacterium]|nr:MATE family efflux transporter [Alcaligenaceae bacterium]
MDAGNAGQGLGARMAEIARQAWPVLIASWAGVAFGVIDTTMGGHAGAMDLQIMALAISIYVTVFVGLMGIVHALIPILAQHYGAGREREVGRMWGQGIWLAIGLCVAGSFFLLIPDVWLSISGNIEPQVREGVRHYLRALVLALPAALMFRSIYALATAVSRPRTVMVINIAGIFFKLFFNWLFMFGNLGLPAMGAAGAGLSTAVVSWLMLAAGLWTVLRNPWYHRFRPRLNRPNWRDQAELLRLGIPMGGSYLIEVAAFTFMALLAARDGVFVTGAHQIMANLAALCYMVPMALGIATASLTAQAIGARRPRLARLNGRAGIILVLCAALLTVSAIIAGRGAILRLYTDDPQVAAVAAVLLTLLPIFHLGDALQCIGCYLLRAYKIAVVPLVMQIIALTGVGLLGGWWLGFGPASGALSGPILHVMPDAPVGTATLWLMSTVGLMLSAMLLFFWYGRVVRGHERALGGEQGPPVPLRPTPAASRNRRPRA